MDKIHLQANPLPSAQKSPPNAPDGSPAVRYLPNPFWRAVDPATCRFRIPARLSVRSAKPCPLKMLDAEVKGSLQKIQRTRVAVI
jgi:hypothetical protein